MKATEQYCPVVLFSTLYKVVLVFEYLIFISEYLCLEFIYFFYNYHGGSSFASEDDIF